MSEKSTSSSKGTDDPVNSPGPSDTKSKTERLLSSTRKYAILMETSGEECESWYYFIKYEGNEKALKHLHKQLEKVDWYILDDLSTFDLEMETLVSEITAKELTKVELNSCSFHRKFDGRLKKINLNFSKRDNNEEKMVKVFDILGYGQIEDFIGDEDIDDEDLVSESDEVSSDVSSSDASDSSNSDTDSDDVKDSKEKKYFSDTDDGSKDDSDKKSVSFCCNDDDKCDKKSSEKSCKIANVPSSLKKKKKKRKKKRR